MNLLKKLQTLIKKSPADKAQSSSKEGNALFKKFKLKPAANKQNERLFFYTDGFLLSAAIITREGDKLKIQASAHHSAIAEDTLANVLRDLSAQSGKLPSHAIMLHSRMALGLLDLPTADNALLTEDKIANIVRWEMETLYGEQAPQWNIGSLLVQLGIITDHERDDIVKIQLQNKHRAASSGGKMPRFGEVAVSSGKVDQQTLEKYLALQSEMQTDDAKVQSGWYQSTQDANIFCAAMSIEEQSRWVLLFDECNLHIDRFYPVSGSLCALIEPEPLQGILELHAGSMVFSTLAQGVVQSMDILNTMERSLTTEDILKSIQLQDKSFKSLYLWGDHPRTDTLFEELAARLDTPLAFLEWPAEKLVENTAIENDNFLYPILGVAHDYFFQDLNNGRIPYVQGMPPPPRFYQRKKWQVAVGVISAILLMGATNHYFQNQVDQAQSDIERLKLNYKKLKKSNKKLNRDNVSYRKLDAEYNTLDESFKALQIQKKAVEVNLIERQKFMREFLPLLIKSLDQNVVIDSLGEDNWYQFRLTGWALNLASVNRFERALARKLGVFNMIINKSPSTLLSSGELAGAYRFNFQLIRKSKVVKK
jgi:hypothetical protein